MNLLRRNRLDPGRAAAWLAPVTVRLAAPSDAPAIERIAELDSRPPPPAPRLVSERDGAIEAVLSLRTGEAVADPFRRTAELVELLAAAGRRA
jgi:hypothetical protein